MSGQAGESTSGVTVLTVDTMASAVPSTEFETISGLYVDVRQREGPRSNKNRFSWF